MLGNLVISAFLIVSSILAAIQPEEVTNTLIRAKEEGHVEQTFKSLQKEHDDYELSGALVSLADLGYPTIVAECLRMARDPHPGDELSVSFLVDTTLAKISTNEVDTEAFTTLITSFNPTDVKPLISIRFGIFQRDDDLDVLKGIMDKSPTLITDDLPNWLAFHGFNQISSTNKGTSLEEAFQYLASLATQRELETALSIVDKNEHYVAFRDVGESVIQFCGCLGFPLPLSNRIKALLNLLKTRKAYIKVELLPLLPNVLVELVAEYTACETV